MMGRTMFWILVVAVTSIPVLVMWLLTNGITSSGSAAACMESITFILVFVAMRLFCEGEHKHDTR